MNTIQKIVGTEQIDRGDYEGYFNVFCLMDDGTKIQVLAKSEDRWSDGDTVQMKISRELNWEGPDGEEGWVAGKFDRPQQGGSKPRFQGNGNGHSKPIATKPTTQTVAVSRSDAMPAISAAVAAAVYDDFFASSLRHATEQAILFVGKDKELPMAVVFDQAKARAGALFTNYMKSFRISYDPKPTKPAATRPSVPVAEEDDDSGVPF